MCAGAGAMNRRTGWRTVGAVLRLRLDVRVALRRETRHAPDSVAVPIQGPTHMTAEETLRLLGLPDLPAREGVEIPQAPWPAVFSE